MERGAGTTGARAGPGGSAGRHVAALCAVEPPREQTFHEFASAWLASIKKQIKPGTQLDYENQLRVHLLPFFKDHLLSQITVAEVDRYREQKVQRGDPGRHVDQQNDHPPRADPGGRGRARADLCGTRRRSAASVGRSRRRSPPGPTWTTPSRSRRSWAPRGASTPRGPPSWRVAFGAAGHDHVRRPADLRADRARLARRGSRRGQAYVYASQRPTQGSATWICSLCSQPNCAASRRHASPFPRDPVFASAAGTRMDRNRVLKRVLGGAIERADKQLAKARPHGAAGRSDAPRAAPHVRLAADRARQGSGLRDGADRGILRRR